MLISSDKTAQFILGVPGDTLNSLEGVTSQARHTL